MISVSSVTVTGGFVTPSRAATEPVWRTYSSASAAVSVSHRRPGRPQEAVHFGDVDPHQQMGIVRGVRPAIRGRACDSLMDCSYGSDRALGVRHCAVRGQRDVPAGALEPSPEIGMESGMLSDCLHRYRMERLQEQRADGADEHRRIAVHPPDCVVVIEPTLARAPDLSMLRLEVPGNAFPHRFRNAGTRILECPDHHIAERMRLHGLSPTVPGHGRGVQRKLRKVSRHVHRGRGELMAALVTVRWRTPPPSSIDERLVVTDDGHARLEVLKPRSLGDTVGTYEGPVEETDVGELTAAGPEVELNDAVQDPRLAAVAAAADRVVKRLLDSPLAVAQFFARPVGAVPPLPETLALGVWGRLAAGRIRAQSRRVRGAFQLEESPVSSTPLPELSMEFVMPDAEGLGGVRQRATIAPGIVGTVSVPLVVPDDADELSVQVVGRWILPDEQRAEDFEVRTESQKL